MILFNKQLLFVHNPKTAGTSLLRYLGERLAGQVYRAGVREIGTHHPSLPLALGYACGVTGNRVEDFRRIISVARDPFDREVSMYVHFRDNLFGSPGLRHDLNDTEMERAVAKSHDLAFRDYIPWLVAEFGTCDIWHSRCYYRMAEGRAPDMLRILKMESLDNDLAAALEGLELRATAELPRLNVSRRESTTAYYDERCERLVADSYRWMFEDGLYPWPSCLSRPDVPERERVAAAARHRAR